MVCWAWGHFDSSSSSSFSNTGGYAFDSPLTYAGGSAQGGGGEGNPTRLRFVADVVISTSLGLLVSLVALESDVFYPRKQIMSPRIDNNGMATTHSVTIDQPPPPQWISPVIPLVPGRSVIADTLCGPLTEEFRKFPKDLWRSGSRNRGIEGGFHDHMALYANMGWRGTKYYQQHQQQQRQKQHRQHRGGEQQDDSTGENVELEGLGENSPDNNYNDIGMYERLVVDSLQGFVINCERRSRHERNLRKLRGGLGNNWRGRHSPVVIPKKGVLCDDDLELDDIYLVDEEDLGV